MLPASDSYDGLVASFEWCIPPQYNIGVDACFHFAADDGRGEAGHRLCGRVGPAGRLRGDQHAGGAHVERFGERIGDRYAAPLHTRISPLPGTAASPVYRRNVPSGSVSPNRVRYLVYSCRKIGR